MFFSFLIYIYGSRRLPPDALTKAKAARSVHAPLTRQEWKAIGAFALLVTLGILFWAGFYQQYNSINLWTDAHTDRDISIFGSNFTIPTTWFQTFNSIYILLLTPILNWFWIRQAARGREPASSMKLAIGCWLMGLSFLVMLGPVAEAGSAGKASWLWLIGFYAVYTAGELYLSPVGLSLVTKIAPARMVSVLMGVWFLSFFGGGYAAGWLGSFFEIMPKSQFFLMIAAIPIVAGTAIALLNSRIRPLIKE
jgi:POT family proton-dependent oligopeptide transporter